MDNIQKEPMIFDIHVTEGTHYEVGKQRAITFKEYYSEDISYYTTPMEGRDYLPAAEAHKRMMMIDRICPGFTDEIQGFADEVNIEAEKILCYVNSFHDSPNCCQFAVLPSNTSNGHFYVGRSYEYFVRDERSLCITRVKGKPKHMGFSLQNAGRMDGMNEYGLVVSMSSTAYLKPLEGFGCEFWIAIRAILDRCKNVYEAQCLLEEIPLCTNANILVADTSNHVAIFEIASFSEQKKKINVRKPVGDLIVSTNHYVSHEMKEFDEYHLWNSEIRYSAVWNTLLRESPNLDHDKIKHLLTTKYPFGPCCHFYSSGMGTLRSMIFDITEKKLKVSLGPPDMNPWYAVDFDEPVGMKEIVCSYEDVIIDSPEQFWREM
ncbi:C45 family autoproteolytic acyltransferase/hydolase [Chengkuizengella axinellae]|uniref:C45 family peptidase n=1 Tax=Chengkuizengella axinellae TaxID=3064388 RepID=A0ABT9IY25_9BACL|nr:C45 family peptidase [Chengkuizengella sp. 2205SS18-9]MDP5274264.1 C45 family peptidase [Chengkuizengella sp. 2205SS18-9]